MAAEPAQATWEMPGPSMERLAQILKEDPSLAELMPRPEVKARLAEAGCCVDMIKAACEVRVLYTYEPGLRASLHVD